MSVNDLLHLLRNMKIAISTMSSSKVFHGKQNIRMAVSFYLLKLFESVHTSCSKALRSCFVVACTTFNGLMASSREIECINSAIVFCWQAVDALLLLVQKSWHFKTERFHLYWSYFHVVDGNKDTRSTKEVKQRKKCAEGKSKKWKQNGEWELFWQKPRSQWLSRLEIHVRHGTSVNWRWGKNVRYLCELEYQIRTRQKWRVPHFSSIMPTGTHSCFQWCMIIQ